MKILHISYAKTWGGGEQQMVNLVEGIKELGVQNLVLCIKNSRLHTYLKNKDIQLSTIEKRKNFSSSHFKKLSFIIKDFDADLIHIHAGSFLKDFLILSKFYSNSINCKVIFTMNGMIRDKSFLSKIKYNNKAIHGYYCISKAVEANFRKKVLYLRNYKKTFVVYDGIKVHKVEYSKAIDIKNKFSLQPNVKIIGNIANHTAAKDLITFCKTADYLIHNLKYQNIIFIQIGRETKFTIELESYITQHKLESKVFLLGSIDNARAYLEQFDCFLMTSNREGLSMSILESFFQGVPVVSTNAGGVPEAVIDDETGLLSDVGDFKSLAYNIEKLVLDTFLNERLIANSKTKLHNSFTSEIMAENTLKFYKKIIHEN